MSANDFTLSASARVKKGKGASRRLRREENLVPAIVYGGEKDPQTVSIKFNEFIRQLENEAFYSHIISLDIDGQAEQVILKDLQRHPSKATIYHADFLRVSKSTRLTTKVPLHFVNEESSKGVKVQGGTISHNMSELEVSCLPDNLPEFIEVDMSDVEVGQILHISDLALPEGVESVALSHGADHDLPVVNIQKAKGSSSSDDSDASEGA